MTEARIDLPPPPEPSERKRRWTAEDAERIRRFAEAVLSERERQNKDAARYRWLREHAYIEFDCDSPRLPGFTNERFDAEVDARIDGRVAAHEPEPWPEGACFVDEHGNFYDEKAEPMKSAVDVPACRKCDGAMKPGKAIAQTMDCSDEGTCSPSGPGVLIDCMKCERCGWSVTRKGD